jgi:hypothetical protein
MFFFQKKSHINLTFCVCGPFKLIITNYFLKKKKNFRSEIEQVISHRQKMASVDKKLYTLLSILSLSSLVSALDHFDYVSVTRNKFHDSKGVHKFVIRDNGRLFSRSRRDLNLLDKMKLGESAVNAAETSSTSHVGLNNQTVVHIPDRSLSLCTYSSVNSRVNQCFQDHTNCRYYY